MSTDASLNASIPPIDGDEGINPHIESDVGTDAELVNTAALADLADIIEEEAAPIDPKGLQETTDLLNANLHNTGGMDYTRISEIQRAHLLMKSVNMSYSQGELNSQMDSKPTIVKKERLTNPIDAGYVTTTEEVTELYMDMRARTLQNIDNLNFDTTLNLANMAARLGDVEAMNVALGRMNALGTATKDTPASNELFFDTLAIVVNKYGELDPNVCAKIETNLTNLLGKLNSHDNITFSKLPESVWPFLVAMKEVRKPHEYTSVLQSCYEHVQTTPNNSPNSGRRYLNLHYTSPEYHVDARNAHVYRDCVIQNYPRPDTESSQAYRWASGVRGALIPFDQYDRETPELIVDTWMQHYNVNPQKPGVIHL